MAKSILNRKLLDTNLPSNWKALVSYVMLVLLADEDGFVDMDAEQIRGRTGIPSEVLDPGLAALSDGMVTRKRLIEKEALGWRVLAAKKRERKFKDEEAVKEFSRQYEAKYGWSPEWDTISKVQVRRVRSLNSDLYPRIVELYLADPYYAKMGHSPSAMGNATFLNKVKIALSSRGRG